MPTPSALPRVALITGSSRGIGAETARELARAGFSVAINYVRDEASARAVESEIRAAGGIAEVFAADVSIAEQAAGLVDRVVAHFGSMHTLVNNAGVYIGGSLEQADEALVGRLFSLNVFGVIAATRAAAPHLARTSEAQGPGSGNVVNISSIAARARWTGGSIYCATKAAVEALTRCHAAELGPKRVRVNAVSPGVTETDINRDGLSPEFRARVNASTALGRVGRVGDIAPTVAFLASPGGAWITGQFIDVDGGYKS